MEYENIIKYMDATRAGRHNAQDFKIDNSVPKIYLPKEKINMFLDWYDQDLRFQNEIPQALDEGYIFVENNFIKFDEEKIKEDIKRKAKNFHTTYNMIKKAIQMLEEETKNVVVHFKFIEDSIKVLCFIDKRQIAYLDYNLKSDDVPTFETAKEILIKSTEFEYEGIIYSYNLLCLFVAVMWYLATTTNIKRYKYEIERYIPRNNAKKKVVQIKDKRIITTPIYDLAKIKTIKVDKLIQHRKGWTYSHSFGVCGHFRHYKNGKVIFIKPFIKGKNKEKQVQDIILNPKKDWR